MLLVLFCVCYDVITNVKSSGTYCCIALFSIHNYIKFANKNLCHDGSLKYDLVRCVDCKNKQ